MFLKTAVLGLLVSFAAGSPRKSEWGDIVASQWPNQYDDKSFFRKIGDEIEKIICPRNYRFDPVQMICVKFQREKSVELETECVAQIEDRPLCPDKTYKGLLPYEPNCRCFKNCWCGIEFLTTCQSHFVFNADRCEEPEKNFCCEYKEKNSSILV